MVYVVNGSYVSSDSNTNADTDDGVSIFEDTVFATTKLYSTVEFLMNSANVYHPVHKEAICNEFTLRVFDESGVKITDTRIKPSEIQCKSIADVMLYFRGVNRSDVDKK